MKNQELLRTVLEKFGKKIKGSEYSLDARIPLSYLFSMGMSRGFMLVRGFVKQGVTMHYKKLFCGHGVKLKCKNKLMIHDGVTFGNNTYIDALSEEGAYFGKACSLGSGVIIRCSGNMKQIGKGVHMGDNTALADHSFVGATGGVWIGDNTICGQNTRFHSSNHNFRDMDELIRKQGITAKGIRLGENCWVGAGAVFLDGASIGNGCVVAANAVITKEFPDNCIIAGVPAKIIGWRNEKMA